MQKADYAINIIGFNGFGAPDWDRTSDLQLRKLTLFQLSYGYCAGVRLSQKRPFGKIFVVPTNSANNKKPFRQAFPDNEFRFF